MRQCQNGGVIPSLHHSGWLAKMRAVNDHTCRHVLACLLVLWAAAVYPARRVVIRMLDAATPRIRPRAAALFVRTRARQRRIERHGPIGKCGVLHRFVARRGVSVPLGDAQGPNANGLDADRLELIQHRQRHRARRPLDRSARRPRVVLAAGGTPGGAPLDFLCAADFAFTGFAGGALRYGLG